jgi:hypothetical protein
MKPTRARAIAERAHWRDRDPDGTPVLDHIRRVVAATPADAQTVAWLHESLETGHVSEHQLLREGLDDDELRALRLLSRRGWSHSDPIYLAHLELVVRAAGRAGRLARAVKIADLTDRCRHPRVRSDGWAPPYRLGLRRLLAPGDDQLAVAAAEMATRNAHATQRRTA